jgi:hypothetical protein
MKWLVPPFYPVVAQRAKMEAHRATAEAKKKENMPVNSYQLSVIKKMSSRAKPRDLFIQPRQSRLNFPEN